MTVDDVPMIEPSGHDLNPESLGDAAVPESRTKTIALMLESDGPGGAEWLLLRLAEELRGRGHRIVPVGPVRGSGWLGQKFKDHGFEPRTFGLRKPVDWRCAWNLTGMLREAQVDAVHSHEFTMAVYGAVAARLLRVPHVTTMHGNQKMTAAWRRRVALRWSFRNSRAVTAVSHATASQVERDLGLASGTIEVIHNGVPRVSGDPEPIVRELGISADEVVVLAVGNLDRRKGHIVLLQALHGLQDALAPRRWRLVIAAGRGGPERESLEAFADQHGCRDRLTILGQRDDVPNLMAAADVFAMPSLWEGLPLALLEAMIAGKAIVASATAGIPEAITSEEHGILTPPGDVPALTKALLRLLADEDYRTGMAARAGARGLERFTVEAMADGYERLY